MRFRKMPKDRTGRYLRPGDVVQIVGVPSLKGMSKQGIAESLPVFRFLRGKSKRIEAIDDLGMAVFTFSIPVGKYQGWHSVSIEPLLLKRRPDTSRERTRGR